MSFFCHASPLSPLPFLRNGRGDSTLALLRPMPEGNALFPLFLFSTTDLFPPTSLCRCILDFLLWVFFAVPFFPCSLPLFFALAPPSHCSRRFSLLLRSAERPFGTGSLSFSVALEAPPRCPTSYDSFSPAIACF